MKLNLAHVQNSIKMSLEESKFKEDKFSPLQFKTTNPISKFKANMWTSQV